MEKNQEQPFLDRLRLFNRYYTYKGLLWVILIFAVILRLWQYFFNRSLWLDEACLAWNIVNKSYLELLGPLEYGQAAPIGFLFVERFFVQIFGNTDYVLRLFPLLSGISSLFLFYMLIRSRFSREGTLLAVFLFSFSNSLIYFSSDLKQYSSDVAVTLILLLGAVHITHRKLTIARVVLFGLCGALALCLSHPALFVLGGIGLTLSLMYLFRKDFQSLTRLLPAFLGWAISFLGLYLLSYGQATHREGLLQYWKSSFMPFPPTTPAEFLWFYKKIFEIFRNPVEVSCTGGAVALFLAGCFSLFRHQKTILALSISPMVIALIASAFQKYPFEGRLLLFAVPGLIFCVIAGIEFLSFNSNIIRIALALLIGYQPLLTAYHHLQTPRVREEIKPLLQYVEKKWQPGDIIRYSYKTKPAFDYYAPRYGLAEGESKSIPPSGKDWNDLIRDLTRMNGQKRIWIILTHLNSGQEKRLVSHMAKRGTLLLRRSAPGALLFLYDLS